MNLKKTVSYMFGLHLSYEMDLLTITSSETEVSLSHPSLAISLIRPFYNCSPAKLYNDHIDLPLSYLVVWVAAFRKNRFNECNLMWGSVMLSSTPLLITIKKLALLIIANVLQWKCQCGLEACSYFSGSDVLFHASGRTPNKMSPVKVSRSSRCCRYGFRCSQLSFSKVFMTPLEHIRWNFNVLCGQIGSLHLHVRGKLWTHVLTSYIYYKGAGV